MRKRCGSCGQLGHNARTCAQRTTQASAATAAPAYTCVLDTEGAWHLTQEQAAPPPVHAVGAWTSCTRFVEFKRGYDKRRPTCKTCIAHVVQHEARP